LALFISAVLLFDASPNIALLRLPEIAPILKKIFIQLLKQIIATQMPSNTKTGHRTRLRKRFLQSDQSALTDESLLELLLTYAIPRKDVQPIAQQLLLKFGDIKSVVQASIDDLCNVSGIGEQSAIIIKLADHVTKRMSDNGSQIQEANDINPQLTLPFPIPTDSTSKKNKVQNAGRIPQKVPEIEEPTETPLFANAVLKEAIMLLPTLPESAKTTAEARQFFRERLHYSADSTRQRNSSYIVRRMFFNGVLDHALVSFAKRFDNSRELRDVCFYRFIKSEPLSGRIIHDLFLPKIGLGKIIRAEIKNYLQMLFPNSKSLGNCVKAFSSVVGAAGIGKLGPKEIHFNYRDIPINAFAFVLHSEYAEPGMYELGEVEQNPVFKAMLWKPDQILPALYTLRNNRIISNISDIDQIRHVSTRFNLDECVLKITEVNLKNESD
jgi:hypothetical protein